MGISIQLYFAERSDVPVQALQAYVATGEVSLLAAARLFYAPCIEHSATVSITTLWPPLVSTTQTSRSSHHQPMDKAGSFGIQGGCHFEYFYVEYFSC